MASKKESIELLPSNINPQTGLVSKQVPLDNTFNPEVIFNLIKKNILIFENKQDSGILSIRLVNSNLLTSEQRSEYSKYIDAILAELDAFRAEFQIKDSCKSVSQDRQGIYSLLITLPNPALYDAFIKRLVDKNLLPANILENLERHSLPTPLSTRLAPGQSKRKVDDEEDQNASNRPSPFKKKCKPDGLS